MKERKNLLRSVLSEQSTEQLNARLVQALHEENVNEDAVRTLLAVLQDREKDMPVEIAPELNQAWEKYQRDAKAIAKSNVKSKRIPSWLLRAASIGIVVVLLFTLIPTNAQAKNFWERLARWTDGIFELLDPHGKEAVQSEYVFRTDNPGLQQVYDTVVEMGIMEPAVPMWLPEGYELVEWKENSLPHRDCASFYFSDGNNEMLFELRKYDHLEEGQYQKDGTEVHRYEIQGNVHYIMKNYDMWTAIWAENNIECYFTIECQETVLYDIIKSIYGVEGSA